MAKITFADPAPAAHRQTGGDNIYPRGKNFFVRRNPRQVPKATSAREAVRTRLKELTALWANLSSVEKDAWETYRTYLALCDSAYQAFAKINTQLLLTEKPGVVALRSISSPPVDPHTPSGFQVDFVPAISQFCVSWTNDYCADVEIKAWKWTPPGKERHSAQPFAYLDYAPASAVHLLVDAEFHDIRRKEQITIRALNARGEISAFAIAIEEAKTAHRSGRYGITAYSFSRYGGS